MTRLRLKLRRAESQQAASSSSSSSSTLDPPPPPPAMSVGGSPRVIGGGGGGGVGTPPPGGSPRPLSVTGRLYPPLLHPQQLPPPQQQPPQVSSPAALTPSKIVALQKDPSSEMQQATRERALSQENALLKKQVQSLQQEVNHNKGTDKDKGVDKDKDKGVDKDKDKGLDKGSGQDKDKGKGVDRSPQEEVPSTVDHVEGLALVAVRTQLTTAQSDLAVAHRRCQEANAQAQGLAEQVAAMKEARQKMGVEITEVGDVICYHY